MKEIRGIKSFAEAGFAYLIVSLALFVFDSVCIIYGLASNQVGWALIGIVMIIPAATVLAGALFLGGLANGRC
jgi:hypothetical protein